MNSKTLIQEDGIAAGARSARFAVSLPSPFAQVLVLYLEDREIVQAPFLREFFEDDFHWVMDEHFQERLATAALPEAGLSSWPAPGTGEEALLLNACYRVLAGEKSDDRKRHLASLRRVLATPVYEMFCNVIATFRSWLTLIECRDLASHPRSPSRSEALFVLESGRVMDALPHVVWSSDGEGNTDYINHIWHDYTGAASGRDWFDYVHPDDRQNVIDRHTMTVQTQAHFDVEFRIRGRDGIYRWFVSRARELRDADGKILRWVGTCTDIDEQKNLSESLRSSEILFKMASRATRNIIWEYLHHDDVVIWNESLVTQLGYSSENLRTPSDFWLKNIHPDDQDRVEAEVQHGMDSLLETWECEYRFRRSDGNYGVFIDRFLVMRDSNNEMVRMIGAMEDVTREREAAALLRASEQRWRTLTNSMPQIAYIAGPKGEVTWFNDRWYEFTGLSSEDSLDHQWRLRLHPEHCQRIVSSIERSHANGTASEETFPLRGKDGDYQWFLSRTHPICDENGAISYWLGTYTDITRQLRLTEKIREREEHLRIATEVANLGTWTLDLRTNEGSWDRQAAELFAMTGQQRFSLFDFLSWTFPEDRSLLENYIYNEIEFDTRKVNGIEIRIIRSDGSLRWVAVAAKKLEHSSPHLGKGFFIVGTLLDLTDRITVQNELKHAKDLAESANAAKSAFLANMSHEIRTPLGAILGFTGLLKNNHYSAEQKAEFFGMIDSAGTSLARIIDDVLDLSKIEAGRIEIESVRFSLHDLLQECASLFMIKAQSKGIALSCHIPADLPKFILSDSTRVRQILLNLIGNAVKFTNQGSVRLDLEGQSKDADRIELHFHVIDTGIGMSEEQQSRIFQPFTQADNSTTRTHGGTGLGLALSKRLALALGGDISVRSNEGGVGCTFTLHLSAALPGVEEGMQREPHDSEQFSPVDLKGLRLLVAEDSPEIQFLLENILADAGASVDIVNNGFEAIQKVKGETFDAILMDIQMPLVDGYEATKTIRSLGYCGAIVALTAHAMVEERQRTKAAGCDFHLTKPIHPGKLLATLALFSPSKEAYRPSLLN